MYKILSKFYFKNTSHYSVWTVPTFYFCTQYYAQCTWNLMVKTASQSTSPPKHPERSRHSITLPGLRVKSSLLTTFIYAFNCCCFFLLTLMMLQEKYIKMATFRELFLTFLLLSQQMSHTPNKIKLGNSSPYPKQ